MSDDNRAVARRVTFELFAAGRLDLVVHHLTARGTHRGPLAGFAPTCKAAVWREMHLMQFAGGKMNRQWGVVDRLGLLRQLGLM